MKFCIDIDDTIFYSKVKPDGSYELTGYNHELIRKVNKLFCEGHEIILWTGRHWNHLSITQEQLKSVSLMHHTLIMGKPPVDYYVDDKALRPDEFMELEVV